MNEGVIYTMSPQTALSVKSLWCSLFWNREFIIKEAKVKPLCYTWHIYLHTQVTRGQWVGTEWKNNPVRFSLNSVCLNSDRSSTGNLLNMNSSIFMLSNQSWLQTEALCFYVVHPGGNFIKSDSNAHLDWRINPIDFVCQRSQWL